jgi:hypothetical protein
MGFPSDCLKNSSITLFICSEESSNLIKEGERIEKQGEEIKISN